MFARCRLSDGGCLRCILSHPAIGKVSRLAQRHKAVRDVLKQLGNLLLVYMALAAWKRTKWVLNAVNKVNRDNVLGVRGI